MRQGIHPAYHKISAVCVCGNEIQTGSTRSAIKIDICNGCHPFFTGTAKIVDTEGRVERFKKKYANTGKKK